MVRKPCLSGKELEKIIGHLIHIFLLYRPLLSIFRSCYEFIRFSYLRRVRLWPCVQRELEIAMSLLPLVRANLRLSYDPVVSISDACLSGFAVSTTNQWGLRDIRAIAEVKERLRYRVKNFLAPRATAQAKIACSSPVALDSLSLPQIEQSSAEKSRGDPFSDLSLFLLHSKFEHELESL